MGRALSLHVAEPDRPRLDLWHPIWSTEPEGAISECRARESSLPPGVAQKQK